MISTIVEFSVSDRINILQKSVGDISIVTDGFILSTLSNELPTTYGLNSVMEIVIYSDNLPEILITGRLKLVM